MRSFLLRAVLVAMVVTVAPPAAGQFEVHATPKTLTETLDGLPAGDVVAQALPGDTRRPARVDAPMRFSMLGFRAPAGTEELRVRLTQDGESWGGWERLPFVDAEDGPDRGTTEADGEQQTTAGDERITEPLWADDAEGLQVEVTGAELDEIDTVLIDSLGRSGGEVERTVTRTEANTASAAARNPAPDYVTRAEWGAQPYKGTPTATDEVEFVVIHHTAGSNSYTEGEAPGVVRGIQAWHQDAMGWNDIGYNALVDRYGNIYEGRAGGLDNGVVGAHARSFNFESFGVSVMGNFEYANPPQVAIDSLTEIIGYKANIHGIDTEGGVRYPDGQRRPTVTGHRQVGQTTCPGRIMGHITEIRENAADEDAGRRSDEGDGEGLRDPRFPDVAFTSTHRKNILDLADLGITDGCGEGLYCPDEILTRAQTASLLARAMEIPDADGTRFSDVKASGEHAGAISALTDRDVLDGYGDGTFGPKQEVTRAQFATVVSNALGLEPVSTTRWFDDVSRGHTHWDGVTALADRKITYGYGDGTFRPKLSLKRDHAATFLSLSLDHIATP